MHNLKYFLGNRWADHLKPDFHRSSAPHGFSNQKTIQNTSKQQASCFFYMLLPFQLPMGLCFFSVEMLPFQQVMAIIFSANCRRVSVVVALGKDPHQAETLLLGRKVNTLGITTTYIIISCMLKITCN